MNSKAKNITAIAMLCAVSYVVMVFGRFPVVLFLKYDPKDAVIALGGLIWGPMTSCIVSVIVSFLEMLSVSETGIIGCIMNIISSCSFACTASAIYKRKRTLTGAVIGLTVGSVTMTAVMMLWNYLVTPLYMGYPREAVAKLLIPAFLPFNLLKSGLNGGFTFLLYKPVITALRKGGYVTASVKQGKKRPAGLILVTVMIMISCILFILSMNGII
ncbi:ECF transporter S component [Hungatella sp. L12]|uniref:Riboflavin transporter n=1 Tax=Hungatella hominis TaxID=2763050 RepID=A0ABR7HE75_9FIRM|nr:ECF transporter S component [Hungatella hominis]MBC5711458.1 ECF transporter S component [Hungatella hominis]